MRASRAFAASLALCAAIPVLFPCVGPAEGAPDREPWLGAPAFSVPAGELMSAVAALPQPAGGPSEVLLYETSLSLDGEGKGTTTSHLLYRILTAAAVDEGGAVRRQWAPWREARPSIRARVITADGLQHDLDPATLSDAPLGTDDPRVFSDMRTLEGPLPAVAPGSVVELEIVEKDEAALFDAGTVTTIGVAAGVRVRHARVRIEAPESLECRFASRPAGAFRENEEVRDGLRRKTFELRDYEPPVEPEALVPPESDPSPRVSVSTGRSWASVAAAYAAVVDRQIAGADLRAVSRKATASAKTRDEKILALVRHLHDTVRYTGVEFGWAGIVPEKPSSTLHRKYGDCKDKSALLVALLREAGIPAHLALLDAGFGADAEPELPGLGRFDHAIVKVDGVPPAWIDATDEYSDPGTLAPGVSGRLALVVRDGSTGLERIPDARAADHRTVEVREFFLAEEGPARVVEVTTAWGGAAAGYRSGYAASDAKKARERFEEYARGAYGDAKVDRYVASDPKDLAHPFELRLELSGANEGRSNGRDIRVSIPLAQLALPLAPLVRPRIPKGEIDRKEDEKSTDPTRRNDLVLMQPYTAEWRYRIHPPAGFAPLPLPERVERSIGPASVAADFRKEDDGTISVDAKFDSGPRRWTAEEFEAARGALYELNRDDPWSVSFEQAGEAHLKAGRLREAMEEFRRLAALHPKEALHHGQIADTLLAAGFGDAARREAGVGTDLEPDSSMARYRLGTVLLTDSLGREFRRGFDYQGAEAALRKAKELDPKNIAARAVLALLLEHDADGGRYTSRSRTEDAIREYRSLRADVGDTTADENVLRCLGYAGRFQDLRDEAAKLPDSVDRNQLLVAAVAAVSGIDAAKGEAGRLASGLPARRELLAGAGWMLLVFRRYPEAGALLEEGFRESEAAAQGKAFLEIAKKARRHEEISFDPSKPDQTIFDFMRTALSTGDPTSPACRALMSRHVRIDESEQREAMGALRYMMQKSLGDALTVDGVVDLGLAGMETEATPIGSTGFQVTLRAAASGEARSQQLYLVKEDDRLKVLGGMGDVAAVGRFVEERIGAGDLENARLWLNNVRELFRAAPTDDPIDAHPMALFWTPGDPPDPTMMRAAAVALRIEPEGKDDVASILERLRGEAAEDNRWKFDAPLALAHVAAERYEAALPCAERLLEKFPRSTRAREMVAGDLMGLDRVDDAEARAREWLTEDPANRQGLRFLLAAAQKRGNADEAVKRFARLQSAGRAEPFDLNNQAWFLLENGRAEEALALAQRAVREGGSDAAIHTLAAVYADLGRLSDARDTIFRKIELFGGGEPEPVDDVVFGRIAEHLGETALAAEAYRRCLGGARKSDDSVRRIVERRLHVLEASRAGKKDRAEGK